MIIGCVAFYNEIEFLEASLKALKTHVDKLVVVDGAYADFPHERHCSTDGSLEIARKYADVVIEAKEAWKAQQDKRNQYFIGKEGDYYLIIDADEILEGKIPKLIEDDYKIMLHRVNEKISYPVYRIIKHRKGLHYWGAHHALWIDNELLNKKDVPIIQGCKIMHKAPLRDRDRIETKNRYYRTRKPREKTLRGAYGI